MPNSLSCEAGVRENIHAPSSTRLFVARVLSPSRVTCRSASSDESIAYAAKILLPEASTVAACAPVSEAPFDRYASSAEGPYTEGTATPSCRRYTVS